MMLPNPTLLLVIQLLTTACTIGFTPSSSIGRLAVLPLLIFCVYYTITTSLQYVHRRPWAGLVGGFSVTFLLQYVVVALLLKWDFEMQGPRAMSAPFLGGKIRSKENDVMTNGNSKRIDGGVQRGDAVGKVPWSRLKFGIRVTTSFRWSGTRFEVKNVPRFSSKNREYVPSRRKFLLEGAFTIVSCYMILDLLNFANDPKASAIYFSSEMTPFFARLRDLTPEQLNIRTFTVLATGVGIYSTQLGIHSLVSLLDVGLGLSTVSSWRPMFGSLTEAYSIRKFWSVVWHQYNRQKLLTLADFVAIEILHLARGTRSAQYTCFILIFVLSGVLHTVVDFAGGVPWHHSGALQFFCTQLLGIIIEEVMQSIYRRGFRSNREEQVLGLWTRIVGYVWVCAFLVWSGPVWLYPMLITIRGGDEDSILPFCILKSVGQRNA